MNKAQIDTQLIEACLLEKWFPLKNGTFEHLNQTSGESCVLCQMYNRLTGCTRCPIKEATGYNRCHNTVYEKFAFAKGSAQIKSAVAEMCDFLISLLPPKHPWRNQSE